MTKLTHRYALIAILLPALALRAQDASKQAKDTSTPSPSGTEPLETLKVTTRIVVLDVVVTDKKGTLVDRELTRDDFTVFEDKQPQKIRSFEPPSEHRMPASETAIVNSAADLKKIGDAPVTILVLDELNSRFEDMSFSRQMTIKYLQSQPAVLKEPTVLMIAMNSTFQQVHGLHSEPRRVDRSCQKTHARISMAHDEQRQNRSGGGGAHGAGDGRSAADRSSLDWNARTQKPDLDR